MIVPVQNGLAISVQRINIAGSQCVMDLVGEPMPTLVCVVAGLVVVQCVVVESIDADNLST